MESRPPETGAREGHDNNARERRPGMCVTCDYWRPHIHYGFIGYCTRHARFTFEDDSCSEWRELKINDYEFYWCSTCKTRIIGVEARDLLRRGHRVHRGAYVDPDVREELYSVF
ncbi:MAG: hypothetical protein F7C38_06685 [Desulfurococcales archaeon]|nr:hypothetical protein [Desulfurococcales archaeon]